MARIKNKKRNKTLENFMISSVALKKKHWIALTVVHQICPFFFPPNGEKWFFVSFNNTRLTSIIKIYHLFINWELRKGGFLEQQLRTRHCRWFTSDSFFMKETTRPKPSSTESHLNRLLTIQLIGWPLSTSVETDAWEK